MGHVVLCALFSTFLWNWLYGAECDFAHIFSGDVDSSSRLFAAVSFFVLLVSLASSVALLMAFGWKRTVVLLVQLAILCLLLLLPLNFFADFLVFVPISPLLQYISLFFLVLLYFSIGFLAFFTDRLPPSVQRLAVVFNCSFIAVILLRCCPHDSTWQIMLLDIAWDFFSVLAGPVRTMFQNCHDYGAQMLRCVLFSGAEEPKETNEEGETAEESETEEPTNKRASEALGGVQLGIGDFVLFSILFALAWRDHPSGAIAALVGISVGLFVNFVVAFSYARRTDSYYFVPALPCTMLLAMALHFGTLFAVKAIARTEKRETILL